MGSHPKHGLKIADTPTEDDEVEASSNTLSPSSPPAEAESNWQSSIKSDHPQIVTEGAQRLTSEDMEDEINRVKRLNGRPTLARDTCQDE